ncbi:MAG TPA: Mth938-like domain-containing protein [Candidatus Thiothrix moscowensis]|uniref:Mth938-like domain-containing protein n=1 Tax=unclassified Thiothrix TaxID=2636184 RepID=UPI0025D7D401|nr:MULTISPECIES: Mth938-like domain-containing protein [unclassified Thiothrix]HRJ53283.1 Mth938-like domain-containing protein [Candidatus Thiothrix moscowensis]HRJ93147.1 Mth938-like domain-containing protein [Candidatus Thiothrix moscowensis]
MKFSEDTGNATNRITGYGKDWIRVNQETLTNSFILGANTLMTEWRPTRMEDLTVDDLQALFALQSEVIIIGSGAVQTLPTAAIWKALVQNGIGFEIMSTDAACRTYNVLLSEARRVAAAFFL